MKVNSVVCFYFVALDASLGFHFLLCVCYVNPAYGYQIEINCVHNRKSCCGAFFKQFVITAQRVSLNYLLPNDLGAKTENRNFFDTTST